MISFCLLNEFLGFGSTTPLEAYNSSPGVNLAHAKDANEAITNLHSDSAAGNYAYQLSGGTEAHHTGPQDSFWHRWWPFSSDESDAVNRINENNKMARRLYWEPELLDTYKYGKPAPGFLDHPIGWTVNAVMDNPWKTTAIGLGGAYGAYKAKQWYDKRKAQQQQNSLSNSAAGY